MNPRRRKLASVAAIALCGLLTLSLGVAHATGTLHVQQFNGATRTYKNVSVRVNDSNLALTSNDGKGTLVVGKAACTQVGSLLRCVTYDATLTQAGDTYHIPVQTGTLWLNPTDAKQSLSFSSTQLQPHGVMLSLRTKAGTYLSLTGTIDEMHK